jgi:hypothetical protein
MMTIGPKEVVIRGVNLSELYQPTNRMRELAGFLALGKQAGILPKATPT